MSTFYKPRIASNVCPHQDKANHRKCFQGFFLAASTGRKKTNEAHQTDISQDSSEFSLTRETFTNMLLNAGLLFCRYLWFWLWFISPGFMFLILTLSTLQSLHLYWQKLIRLHSSSLLKNQLNYVSNVMCLNKSYVSLPLQDLTLAQICQAFSMLLNKRSSLTKKRGKRVQISPVFL